MINITKIYLVENCYGDPNKVYIGKTKNNRKYNHSKTYGSQITYTYIDEVNSINHSDWESLETYWIEQFKQWGFQVMNIRKKGGSGPDFQTEETKQKISKSLKNHSKHYTEEIKLKMKKPKPEGFGYTLGLKLKGISRPDIKGRPSVNKGKISPNKGNKYTWSS